MKKAARAKKTDMDLPDDAQDLQDEMQDDQQQAGDDEDDEDDEEDGDGDGDESETGKILDRFLDIVLTFQEYTESFFLIPFIFFSSSLTGTAATSSETSRASKSQLDLQEPDQVKL